MNKIINEFLPNKKINFFIFSIMILGIISGAIFLVLINENDKNVVINQITNFINNINSNNINSVQALKNSLAINFTYIILIWILGMSIIGIVFNLLLTYIKGFVLGFSVSSIIYVYGFKGIIGGLIYIFPHQILNIMIILILAIYSVMFTKYLYKIILGNKNIGTKRFIKIYTFLLGLSSIITLFSSLSEVFITPALFKLMIKLFIK